MEERKMTAKARIRRKRICEGIVGAAIVTAAMCAECIPVAVVCVLVMAAACFAGGLFREA